MMVIPLNVEKYLLGERHFFLFNVIFFCSHKCRGCWLLHRPCTKFTRYSSLHFFLPFHQMQYFCLHYGTSASTWSFIHMLNLTILIQLTLCLFQKFFNGFFTHAYLSVIPICKIITTYSIFC